MVYSGDPSAFVPSHRRTITAGEQWLIDRAAKAFLARGEWPKIEKLTRDAAREDIELPEFIFGIPVQDYLWRPDTDNTIVLSLTGLQRSHAAAEFVEQFFHFALLCRDIYLADDESDFEEDGQPRVTSDDLRSRLGFDDHTIKLVYVEMRFEYFLNNGGGATSDTDWYYVINQSVAKFRNVQSLEEYFEERAKIVAPRVPTDRWPPVVNDSFAFFDGASASSPAQEIDESEVDPHNVFVVFGRDVQAKDAMWKFLERIGLHPLDWNEMVRLTGKGTPYTGDVIEAGFSVALACVVLMTPDDEARLHADLVEPEDDSHERELTCQPRPNVMFEAGRAFGTHPDHTILVEVGSLRRISDLAGLNVVRIGSTKGPLMALAERLEGAGCPIDRSDLEAFDPSAFANLPSRNRKSRAVDESAPSGPRAGRILKSEKSEPTPRLSIRLWNNSQGRLLEIANSGGVELRDLEWEFAEKPPSWNIMTGSLPYPIPVLAPFKHIRVPVYLASGSQPYVDITFRAKTGDGTPYELTEQLSIYG